MSKNNIQNTVTPPNSQSRSRGSLRLGLSAAIMGIVAAASLTAASQSHSRALGFLALVCFWLSLLFAAAAILHSMLIILEIVDRQETGSGSRRAGSQFLLGALSILVVLGALPGFIKSRTPGSQSGCVNNLRQIDNAKAQWALEKHKVDSDTVALSDIVPYLHGAVIPQCPANGDYSVTTVIANPTCTCGHTL